ncbi:hypothetical protein [Henriciella sp.]|uniref:hypothetical protein n=1 Tax=Henriciella sp. TaxID=1968823 RepID=UPI0026330ED7|nr:hypothetical protein [Henriciella sp.]
MARVPQRRNFEVLPGGGQMGRVPLSVPGRGNEAAANAQRSGQALAGIGGDIGQRVQDQQARINKARVREGALQFRGALQEAEEEYSKLKGAELVDGERPVMREIEQRLEKRRSEILRDMKNEDAQYAFESASAEQFARFQARASAYEAEQAEFYINQQRDAVVIASMETSLSDPSRRDESLASADETLREKFSDEGYSGDRLDQLTQDAIGEFAAGNIESLIEQGEAEQAAAYLESARGYLSGSQASALGKAVDEAVSARKTLSLADQVFSQFDPSQFGRNAPKADIYAYAREVVGDDPEDLKALMAEVEMRIGLYEDQAGDQYAEDYNTAYETAMSAPGRVYGLPAFRRLDAKHKDAILSDIRRRASGKDRETDNTAYAQAYSLIGQGDMRGAQEFLMENQTKFRPTDWRSLYDKASKQNDTTEFDDPRSNLQIIEDSMRAAGLSDSAIKNNKDDVVTAVSHAGRRHFEQTGEEPDEQWYEQKAGELVAEVKVKRPGWVPFNDRTVRVFEGMEFETIPQRHAPVVLEAFGGGAASEQDMSGAYYRAMTMFREEGIANPSDEALIAMIRSIGGTN